MPLEKSQTLHGRYRIDALLGQGGMGAVYRAFDTLYDRACAIKEFCLGHLPEEGSIEEEGAKKGKEKYILTRDKAVRQFKREAKLLASFDHPNLPKVYDYFASDEEYYLVMTLIEGKDLLTILDESDWDPVPEARVLQWMRQIFEALKYCHNHRVIHRDIKPANIIVTDENKSYLVDFGIAKHVEGEGQGTSGMTQMITPRYSPPEQYTGSGKSNSVSDIYALGATMYTLLTGQPPIEAIARATGTDMPSPTQVVRTVSGAVDAVIMKSMQIRVEDRFQDMQELIDVLWEGATAPVKDTPLPAPKAERKERTIKSVALHIVIGDETGSILGMDTSERRGVLILSDPETVIGRKGTRKTSNVDIDLTRLDKKRIISHNHAIVEQQGNQYFLIDTNSRNGTWLNEDKITPHEKHLLEDGDRLQFGSLKSRGIRMVFKLEFE